MLPSNEHEEGERQLGQALQYINTAMLAFFIRFRDLRNLEILTA